jgi:hypothetical protein
MPCRLLPHHFKYLPEFELACGHGLVNGMLKGLLTSNAVLSSILALPFGISLRSMVSFSSRGSTNFGLNDGGFPPLYSSS